MSKPCPTTPQQAGAIDLFDSAQGRPSIARIWVGASDANGLRSVRVDRPYLVYIRRFVRFLEDFREPWPVISGEELCYPPGYFDLMAKIKKRGRPRIRTAEYWGEYYTRKQREWRAAHPRIRRGRGRKQHGVNGRRARKSATVPE